MAKIGNEATLILKLASERVKTPTPRLQALQTRHPGAQDMLKQAYDLATEHYNDTLYGIVREIESK